MIDHQTLPQPCKRRAASTGEALDFIPEEAHSTSTASNVPAVENSARSDRTRVSSGARTSSFSIPVFHPSPSLVSTSSEKFPPAKRRHEIVENESVQSSWPALDAFNDLMELDEDELMELGCTSVAKSATPFTNDKDANPSTIFSAGTQLPTPHPSDEVAFLEALFYTSDDDDEWLQLSDVEPEVVDLTGSTTLKHEGCENSLIQDGHPTFTEDGSRQLVSAGAEREAPNSEGTLEHCEALPPFVRPGFPEPIQDRSPLLNITNSLILKTCFRIGEAINVGLRYARQSSTFTSDGVLIELYARVISSYRPSCHAGAQQDFVFADLWFEKGPRLLGEWSSWKGSEVFEQDSKNLLTEIDDGQGPKMCRAVGKMKRENKEWRFVVLSAWECGWDDIEYVRGIVCRQ
jgi:hypothetical protein